MKRSQFALLFLGIFLANIAIAQSNKRFGQLPSSMVRALKQSRIPISHISMFVQDVDQRGATLALNSQLAMNPASTMKLVTTYAALELLGPAYIWKTEVYAVSDIKNGVLDGDLILKGYGDPTLNLESFWLLLRQLRQRGLKEINGNLVLDRSYFEIIEQDPAKFDNEPLRAYNVTPDALLVNFKTIRFQFIPNYEKKLVTIVPDPNPENLEVINNVRLVPGNNCTDWHKKILTALKTDAKTINMIFDGPYPENCGEQFLHFSTLDHAQYVNMVFRQLWKELGGSIKGKLLENPVPLNAKLLYVHESIDTLSEVVRNVNKFSNNVMARQVFLTMAANFTGQPARVDQGVSTTKAWLTSKKLNFPELKIENGAGLSRQERISAAHMGALLVQAYKSPVMPEFIASMPLVGNDGTMRKRLIQRGVSGQAHIKTGTLEGVKTLAGYVFSKSGRRYVVVLFINHPNAVNGEAVQDAFLEWVYSK